MKILRWIPVILLVCSLPLLAVEAPSVSNSDSAAQVRTLPGSSEPTAEVMKAELKVYQDFTQHILSTVYFSLGTVIIVLVAMIGFNWYQNQRVYERDRNAMRQSLEKEFHEKSRVLETSLGKSIDLRIASHELATKESHSAIDKNMADVLKVVTKRLNEATLGLETSIHRTTHSAPTAITDFMVFILLVNSMIGHVGEDQLGGAVGEIIRTLEQGGSGAPRLPLLELAERLPPSLSAYASRVRDLIVS